MSRKYLIPVLVFVVCMVFAGPADAKRGIFNWFSVEYPDGGWTVLWDEISDYEEAVIIRKRDYSALIILEIKTRMGRTPELYAKEISRAWGGSQVRANNSGGYWFEYNHRVGKDDKLHRKDIWSRGPYFVMFTVHGNDPELQRIANSFKLGGGRKKQ